MRRYLSEMRPGDRADEIFVIHNLQLGKKRNGEPFLKMLICDRSARVNGKWWDRGPAMLEKLPDPAVVRIKGFMEDFQGAPQFIVEAVFAVRDPSRIDYAELLPATEKDVGAMFDDVTALLRSMRSQTLKALAEAYLADEALMADFRRAPAAMMFHHAYLGGLLEHTLAAMRAGAAVSALYPALNGDVVVLGIFLHDLAKTWELRYDTCFDYTDGGRLVGHIVKSAMWLEEKSRAAESVLGAPIPRDVIDLLQHVILSHHGEHELGFGSAKSPASPEAWAVHLIENLDAKLTMALLACRGQERGRWTDHHKALGGRLFRPDVVAEADASIAKAQAQQSKQAGDAPPHERRDVGPATPDPLFET
jgi:3'-5' exoribonuclease